MAASASELGQSSEKADITLTEDDIPGASLQCLYHLYPSMVWKVFRADNVTEMSTKIPRVTSGTI